MGPTDKRGNGATTDNQQFVVRLIPTRCLPHVPARDVELVRPGHGNRGRGLGGQRGAARRFGRTKPKCFIRTAGVARIRMVMGCPWLGFPRSCVGEASREM